MVLLTIPNGRHAGRYTAVATRPGTSGMVPTLEVTVSPNRWLIAAALVLALLIGGSIAVGTSRSGEANFPADSPEGTVQRFVRAIEAEDAFAIRDALSPEAQKRCEISNIRNALRYPDERDLRVALRDSRITGERAEVKVRVSESTGSSLFDSGSYDHDEIFDLVHVGGAWLIEQPTWPVYCPPLPIPPPPSTPAASPTTASGPR